MALQLAVLVLCAAWVLAMVALRPRGYAWSAPPLGLLFGAALPLQLEVFGIMRATRR